ncbi:universal stress protein [Rugamonas apoptosis]|uniref:Universal stress protein n=1 Tax=Rugamonas apoptosis TaxID=2758570 RepID=A0A7W2F9X3_9BURK|nr:universal stress protein [Rugamonas apoptosis]MBA5687734.1 universal stress protein [Rugamonas apoptosis]
MFKHILLPTDGSSIASAMIQKTLAFAKESGAKVTGIHVMADYQIFTYQPEMLADSREQYARDSAAHARVFLAEIENAAKELGVSCDTMLVTDEQPYEAICKAATDAGCDVICMSSHGRRGVKGLLLGSETQKVLTHATVPVLVFR